jgi:glycosyltransferase involved in cell wall biosynthesis
VAELAPAAVAEAIVQAAPVGRRLRVLFLMTRDARNPGAAGGDIGMWERALYLSERGHAVTVVAGGFPGGARKESIDGIEVIRLGGQLLSLWWRTFFYYMARCRGKYDVAVVEGFGGSRIPRMTPLYVREPIITEWHQIHGDLFAAQYPKLLVPALNLLERVTAFVHRNTIVMARTQEWKDDFPKLGFKPAKIFVVPACIGDDWLAEGRPGRVAEPRIIFLGKFRRYKCPDHVIRAMQLVVRSVPNARLILAGRHDDRKYEATLQKLVDQLGLSNNVDFAFDLSEDEKRELLATCRVMALPSSVEGFGIVVLEANACGVPVVASSGVPVGAVRDGVNGLRYPFGDINALGQRLIDLCLNDQLYARLSSSGLAFASQLSWRTVCSQYEKVLHHAVDDRARQQTPDSLA